ncbi:MAG: DUF2125 domain-containing protein [Alphaproteobacteria bacterium]|nr:DUF2125 domain-containing protein [Alphaproteobacteria bacterium]
MKVFKKHRPTRGELANFSHPALHYKKPKQLIRFQAAITLAASAALVAGLWSFAWYAAATYVKKQVAEWTAQHQAAGATVTYAEMDTAGYPTRIRLTLTQPRYAGPAFGGTADWQGESLVVEARPWSPWALNIQAPGRHKLIVGDGALTLSGSMAVVEAGVELGPVWPRSLDLRLQDVTLKGSADIRADALRLGFFHVPDAQGTTTGLQVLVDGKGLVLPTPWAATLGERIDLVDAALRITGSVGPDTKAAALPAWRDAGGEVKVDRLRLRQGPVALVTSGALRLDDALQPQGAFTAKFEGLFQLLEILRAQGYVRGSDAVVATMALSALVKRPTDGSAPFINLAVNLVDRQLALGPVPVMILPEIHWGLHAPAAEPPAQHEPKRDYKNAPTVF